MRLPNKLCAILISLISLIAFTGFWHGTQITTGLTMTQVVDGMVFQRAKGTTQGPAIVSGTYVGGPPGSIDLQIVDGNTAAVVVDWTAVSPTAAGFAWQARAPPTIPQGGPYKINSRLTANHSLGTTGNTNFYIGIWIIGYGQSNEVGLYQGCVSCPAAVAGTFSYNGNGNVGPLGFQAVPESGARYLLNAVTNGSGIPSAFLNVGVDGANIDFLAGTCGDPANCNVPILLTQIDAIGGDAEIMIWDQGEANTNGSTDVFNEPAYWALLQQLQTAIGNHVGRTNFPISVASIGALTGTAPVDFGVVPARWAGTMQTAADLASGAVSGISYSHSNYDLTLGADGLHYTAASQAENGKRFGQSVLKFLGNQTHEPAWFITSASVTDNTHTVLNLTHSMGTDFTPTTGITGAELSADNGATWITPSAAVRTTASSITLTHASISNNARLVRYQYSYNANRTGLVVDNGSLTSPLNFNAYGIAATTATQLPVPTFVQQCGASYVAGTAVVSNYRVGTAFATRFGVFQIALNTNQAFPSAVTFTPDTGTPVAGTLVDQTPGDSVTAGIAFWQAALPQGTTFTITMTFPSNPFSGIACGLSIIDLSLLSSTTKVGAGHATAAANTTVSTTLATTAGGFVIAATWISGSDAACTISGSENYAQRWPWGQFGFAADAAPTSTTATDTVTSTCTHAHDIAIGAVSYR